MTTDVMRRSGPVGEESAYQFCAFLLLRRTKATLFELYGPTIAL
jgi:hypothetical protein